jgi:hypothetical protein
LIARLPEQGHKQGFIDALPAKRPGCKHNVEKIMVSLHDIK